MLFLPALAIYVLRVAQWHVGRRQTETPAETLKKYFFRKSTILTIAFYTFSAWLYSETYIWSRTGKDKLGFTELGREYERIKLNERPLYLRYLFLLLAVAQSGVHLWRDYDRIDVPAMKPKKEREDAPANVPIRRSPKPRHVLTKQFLGMATKSASLTAVVGLSGSVLYFFGPRSYLWEYYYSLSRYLWSLSKTSKPTGLAPFLPLVLMFAMEGTLLVLLWEFVNKAFDLYIAQEPLKNDKPITDDSKDPNGTLLNGLKSKKDAVRVCQPKLGACALANNLQAIAFWELAMITDAFPDRRKTIYSEQERKKAPTFQQVTDLCLGELRLLIERLSIGLDPTYNPSAAASKQQPAASVNLVPQIAQPLKNDKQVVAPPLRPNTKLELIEAAAAGLAKSHSAPGNSQQAYGREAINKGTKKAQEGAQQASSFVIVYWNKLVSSRVGSLFQKSLQRTANVVVLGAPYSRISLVCNAVTALANLTVFSLSQDALGRFHQGIPEIVRVLTIALNKVDAYMSTVPIHWSDKETLNKPEAERRKVPEVEEVRECLREGLEKILGSFNEYLSGMGLSKLEILEAKKVVGLKRAPEMIQAGR